MTEALLVISQKGYGVTGVTDAAGALIGIITDGDLRRHMQGLLDLRADEVMTRNPRVIRPEALAEAAMAEMQSRRITCLFAVEDGKPCGILHIHDCLRAGLA
jgi:arabinose-5-phosphate isomerase